MSYSGLDEDDGSNFFILANLSKRTKELARIQTQFNAGKYTFTLLKVTDIVKI